MRLSRIEANWIASRILSDAEREREHRAARRTAGVSFLYPMLKMVRPTERGPLLRSATRRAGRDPKILSASFVAVLSFLVLSILAPRQFRSPWWYMLPTVIWVGCMLAWNIKTRTILRATISLRDRNPVAR